MDEVAIDIAWIITTSWQNYGSFESYIDIASYSLKSTCMSPHKLH
jgi:hypothetical protein